MNEGPGTTSKKLDAILSVLAPRSVVVVGASPVGRGFNSAPITNLKKHGYDGCIYAINPKYDEIQGVPCYPDVLALPEAVDTAVIVVGARRVASTLASCAEKGITSATVIAGGFAELGAEGAQIEAEIRGILDAGGLRLVGPNTAGLMSPIDRYVPRAALNHPDELLVGSIALVTQSGALCNTLLNRAMGRGLGLSHAIATGSQWDLDVWDFAEHLIHDERVSAVMLVVEGLNDAMKALRVARVAADRAKPLILFKPGRSERGAKAVQTHSGALSGESAVQFSILRSEGVLVVEHLDELWEAATLFHHWGSPLRPVHHVGIATYSGGDGAIAVDSMDGTGLDCPEPSPETAAIWADSFSLATPANPFDFTGEVVGKPELIAPAFSAMLKDQAFDCCLLAAPVWSGHFASWILGPALDEGTKARGHKPTAVSLWGARGVTEEAEELVRASGLPLFDGSERAIGAITRYSTYADWLAEHRAHPTPAESRVVATAVPPDENAPKQGSAIEDYWTSRELLAKAGVPFNSAALVHGRDEAITAATKLGLPVTLKAISADAVHKVAAGAVKLYLRDEAEVAEAWEAFAARFGSTGLNVVVESYTPSVSMALLGGVRSPEFGPVMIFGLGGGYAETFGDVSHALAPLTPRQTHTLILRTQLGRMIAKNRAVTDELVDLITQASAWFAASDSVLAFDVNPLLIGLDDSVIAVDARVELRTG